MVDYIQSLTSSKDLQAIAAKVFDKKRISVEEGIALFDAPLGFLGALANWVREQKTRR
jgi:hypothetical protein